MIAQMTEQAATNSEVPSLSLRSGSYESQTKLKPYCLLQHVIINSQVILEIKEFFTNVKQVSLLYLWGSLVTLLALYPWWDP